MLVRNVDSGDLSGGRGAVQHRLGDSIGLAIEMNPEEGAVFQEWEVLLEVRIASGARDDLGRPKSTPSDNKAGLMGFLHD